MPLDRDKIIEEILALAPPTRNLVDQARVNLRALSDDRLEKLFESARSAAETADKIRKSREGTNVLEEAAAALNAVRGR